MEGHRLIALQIAKYCILIDFINHEINSEILYMKKKRKCLTGFFYLNRHSLSGEIAINFAYVANDLHRLVK